MAKWNGHERRGEERRHGWCTGVCAEHELIQDSTKEHRGAVCSKIAGVDTKLEKLRDATVPWKVFVLIASAAIIVVGAGFGFFGVKLDKIENKHDISMDKISTVLSGMAQTQASMLWKITEIEKHNDRIDGKNTKP